MADVSARAWARDCLWVGILVLASVLLFWKIRILDLGTDPTLGLDAIDLYIEHTPMAQYAYEQLASGNVPLWNPYQLCGQPFIAVPHVAAFYPLHIFSLFVDVGPSVEVSFLLHMFLGGMGMWLLARRVGLSSIGALGAAVTFMWSGWIVFMSLMPGIFASLNWLPVTILLLDRAVDRAPLALPLLIGSVASQILLGATEVLLHTMYVGAAFTASRLSQLVWRGSATEAATRGAAILAAMAAALLVAAPQLLPSIEFVSESGRGREAMSFETAVYGAMQPFQFLRAAMDTAGYVTVGVLPFLALPLGFGVRRHRFIWIFAFVAALLAALLVFGGPIYQGYYSLPVVGGLFRRPTKFLDIYAFAQALMAGVALAQLQVMATWPRAALWRDTRWLACLALVTSAFVWTTIGAATPGWVWLACLILLLTFGTVTVTRWRCFVLVGLLSVHAASLFLQVGHTRIRSVKRPEIFHTQDKLLGVLREKVGTERVHLSSFFTTHPGLTAKQGLLNQLKVSSDYEPLAARRYRQFFNRVTPNDPVRRIGPFAGIYSLTAASRWELMDLTSSRYYLMADHEPAAEFMRNHSSEFRLLSSNRGIEIFERSKALPRAYLVPTARVLESEEEVLSALIASDFDPRRGVLLEKEPSAEMRRGNRVGKGSSVKFVMDDPDHVVIDVSTPRAAFLVLNDMFYPGWRAFDGDNEIDIYRANYLFRAVQLQPGRREIHFVYEPGSFRLGLLLSGLTLTILVIGFVWRSRSQNVAARVRSGHARAEDAAREYNPQ